LSLRILNKGTTSSKNIRASVSSTNPGVVIPGSSAGIDYLGAAEIKTAMPEIHFRVEDPERAIAKFDLELEDDAHHLWKIPFEVRLFAEVKELEDVQIADGRSFRVQSKGDLIEEKFLGIGNGDGEVNPGESIVALVRDAGELHFTSLFSHDDCVNASGLNLRFSDYWGDYDHVGGSVKYSMPTVSSKCKPGHEIVFFAEYILPHAPEHLVRRGLLRIRVTGNNTTAPKALSAELGPGNILEVEAVEGGSVKSATARIVQTQDPSFEIVVELNDGGLNGDRAANDNYFSSLVPDIPAGEYQVTIELTDDAGNSRKDSFRIRTDSKF